MPYNEISTFNVLSGNVTRCDLALTGSDTTRTGGQCNLSDHNWKPNEHFMMGKEHAYLRTDRDGRFNLPGGRG